MTEIIRTLELETIKSHINKYTTFELGRRIIAELTPSFNHLVLKQDLARTSEALRLVIKYGPLPFVGLRDITDIITIAQKDGVCTGIELLDVAAHAYCCKELNDFIKSVDGQYDEIGDLINALSYSVALSKEIERCISLNGEVVDNASAKLKSLKKQLNSCEVDIHTAVDKYIRANTNHLSDTISTMRNERYVVLVKNSDKGMIKGFIHGESASGQTVYMEPESLLHFNNQRLSLIDQIQDEIYRILFELSQMVKKQAESYLANLETLALLDSYNAKAVWAKLNNATVAEIGDRLILKGARHPLIDPKKVVMNTYRIIPPCNTLLITGPNTGGKTVSLKTIGLFVLMTYCGIAISCEEAEIPMFDQVFVDMGDNQSIIESLSTFSAHLKQLAYICDQATSKSLILLDELGGGTDPLEGECLAIAILDYLRNLNAMIVATTHYDRLKAYGKKHEDVMLASVQFDTEKLVPTYRYKEGLTGQSNSLDIADKFGLDQAIIAKAKELKDQGRSKEDVLIEELERSIIAHQQQEETLKSEINSQKSLNERLSKEYEHLKNNEEKIMNEVKQQAVKYLEKVTEEADELLKEMRKIKEDGQLHEGIALKKELSQLVENEEETEELDQIFAVNDHVQIKNTNQSGEIESIDRKKAIVNANGIKITVPLTNLIKKEKQKPKKQKIAYRVNKPENLSFELNLIGMRTNEAVSILEKYLDDCLLMNAPYIRIIHGFGTGALRKAVWANLKNNRFVEDIRLGMQQEGGSGATIVTLKKRKQ